MFHGNVELSHLFCLHLSQVVDSFVLFSLIMFQVILLQGYVTTMKSEDHPTLCRLLSHVPEDIEQAGLHPTADQIELFAYHLPSYTLSNLIVSYLEFCSLMDVLVLSIKILCSCKSSSLDTVILLKRFCVTIFISVSVYKQVD